MQLLSNARRVSRLLQSPISHSSHLPNSQPPIFSGLAQPNHWQVKTGPLHFFVSNASFTSGWEPLQATPTEAVKELYDKMLESVNTKRSMPPNAWLWQMIANCKHQHDIGLLFEVLQKLRTFRLSNLRIHDDFNCNLCREVAKACVHAGALDFGKKALWKHNVYGLAPSVASAHHLLTYAKNHNDTKLLVEVMKLLKRNDVPLQPGTADIVFSICYNTDEWDLINKYGKRFVLAGVKLRPTSIDTWMKFAAKRGDTESLWKIEKMRSDTKKPHTLATGFSCAKGLLLEHKPSEAAAKIEVLNQTLSDAKKSGIKDELQKLISEWPLEVIKHKKEEERKTLAASLKSDIRAMVSDLLNTGLEVNLSLEELNSKEGIPQ